MKDTLLAIFRRRGGDGEYLRVFERLGLRDQEFLTQQAGCSGGEIPILGTAQVQNEWLLLTTERLIWTDTDGQKQICLQNIENVMVDLKRIGMLHSTMDKNRELEIVLIDGRAYKLITEAGPPFSGLWNILAFIARRNRSQGPKR
jgi:hypothetical protein